MLKYLTIFSRTWWIHSNIASEVGFPEVIGLAFIPYYSSIRDFLNSLPIHSDPWSYLVFIGIGYLDIRIVSTKFAIDISLVSLYYVISNHHVTVLIIITAFIWKFLSITFYLKSKDQLDPHRVYSMVFTQLL